MAGVLDPMGLEACTTIPQTGSVELTPELVTYRRRGPGISSVVQRFGALGGSLAVLLALAGCGSSVSHRPAPTRAAAGGAGGSTSTGGAAGSGVQAGIGGRPTMTPAPEPTDPAGGSPDSGEPLPDCSSDSGRIVATSQLRRLTANQYERTVGDLLGVTTVTALGNARVSALLGPDTDGDITALQWDAYQQVGAAIAAQVMTTPELQSRFLTCPASALDDTCLHDSAIKFARLAFRRPPSQAELARFDGMIADGAALTETGAPLEVAEVLLNAILVTPSFLQRVEVENEFEAGPVLPLSSYELATRLSYFLWASTPDETLLSAAETNQLVTAPQILAQAQRMLADPRARDVVAAFQRHYLSIGANAHWDTVLGDDGADALGLAMLAETERFFVTLILERKGAFGDLFTSPLGFVNESTAPFYGLDPTPYGTDLQEVSLDPVQRPGFLTRLGFLMAFSVDGRTSPSFRGYFVMAKLLGTDVPAHPGDVSAPTPLPDRDTNRESIEAVTAGANCEGCHRIVDPPGFALENYDSIGRFITVDGLHGGPIDPVADVLIGDMPLTVHDPAELMQALAQAPPAQKKFAQALLGFARQRDFAPADECTVNTLLQGISVDEVPILDLFADLTQTPDFRERVRETP